MTVLKKIQKDLNAVLKNDPAARNKFEVILTYSGFHALLFYRLAHFFYRHKYFLIARIISQSARFFTGIEIHPGAKIGSGVFIDHGSGVIIGETTIIGNNVTIFQGVTLGGTGKEKGKRHPTIEDGVMVCAGAKVLGSVNIGKGAKIGAGSIVLKEVPPYSTVVGVPGRVVKLNGEKYDDLDQDLPDPISEELLRINEQINAIIDRLGKNDTK